MIRIFSFAFAMLMLGWLGAAAPARAQGSPPESDKSKQVMALVERAAAALDAKGKTAFPEFRQADGPWRSGDIYLFVVNLKGRELFNAAFPQLEGTDVTMLKDPQGKSIGDLFVGKVKSADEGWVDYLWPKPGQTANSRKWTFVKAATVDGVPALVGAGFYPE